MGRPMWLRRWPWWGDRRTTKRASREAERAKEEATEHLQRAEDRAAEAAAKVAEEAEVIEQLRERTAELWPLADDTDPERDADV